MDSQTADRNPGILQERRPRLLSPPRDVGEQDRITADDRPDGELAGRLIAEIRGDVAALVALVHPRVQRGALHLRRPRVEVHRPHGVRRADHRHGLF